MRKIAITFSTVLVFVIMLAFGTTAQASERINIDSVELSQSSYTYTGKKIFPEFKVYDENGKLVKNDKKNYTFVTANSKNVGTASVRVKGRNKYQGSITVEYKITPREITSAKYESFDVVLGKKTPEPKLKYKNKVLVKGTDYKIKVSDITKAGKTVTYKITGLGNFKGTKVIKKVVFPCTVKHLSGSNRTHNGFDLSWKSLSDKGVKNYKIYKCNEKGENRQLIADTTSTSIKVSGFNAGDYVYIVARAYVTVDGINYYSDYSKVYKTVTKPAKVVNTKTVKSSDKEQLRFGWDKAPCTGYQLQYSTDKSFKKGVKTVELSGSSKTSSSVKITKNDKIYYSRVRAYRRFKYNGRQITYYGPWSNKLSTEFNKVYASYKTAHVYNPNRTTNLKLACQAINGTIVQPGDVFSFNAVVGRRTAEKGYKAATIFTGSNSTSQSIGGGICQVASTMFNAVLYANLNIVERHQHSQRVAYCPLGRDAAIYWGSEDFKFKNNSDYPIKIKMRCENGYVYCDLMVSYDVSPPKVSLDVTQSRSTFTLKRYVNGSCNYTTRSTY